ncbi:hypothetical protein SOV_38860 [Sporomusa ovata DSM 2662]|uniref:Uncharacterized protein n=1 Tax=Sporomusa ovata TaxID=2378 RepID=A0A0U1KSG2_9FIRM|nr:hypothetical protein SOV_3c01480 [Sporomusa ovata DSM 2662]CQR70351.1 hypothetical protein SpAn4DRAFT_1320 [Sporomusa ovata]
MGTKTKYIYKISVNVYYSTTTEKPTFAIVSGRDHGFSFLYLVSRTLVKFILLDRSFAVNVENC